MCENLHQKIRVIFFNNKKNNNKINPQATGIVHSYTLECNYNTGITINSLPGNDEPVQFPFRYTPVTWQGVGKALAVAALDMTGENPNSNVQHSEFNTMDTLRLSVLKLFLFIFLLYIFYFNSIFS